MDEGGGRGTEDLSSLMQGRYLLFTVTSAKFPLLGAFEMTSYGTICIVETASPWRWDCFCPSFQDCGLLLSCIAVPVAILLHCQDPGALVREYLDKWCGQLRVISLDQSRWSRVGVGVASFVPQWILYPAKLSIECNNRIKTIDRICNLSEDLTLCSLFMKILKNIFWKKLD